MLRKIASSFAEEYQPGLVAYAGRRTYANGEYEGGIVAGQPMGQGAFYWNNGDTAVGAFDQVGPAGDIAYTWHSEDGDSGNSKEVFHGNVQSGKYSGQGEYYWPQGKFTGVVENQRGQGGAVIEWNSGGMYDGQLVDGIIQGQGKYTWDDGDSYVGGFSQGTFHGKGVCHYGGVSEECTYVNGNREK